MKKRKLLAWLLIVTLIFSTANYSVMGATSQGVKYEISIAVDPNDTTVNLSALESDLKTQMISEFATAHPGSSITANDITINFLKASNIKSSNEASWEIYDHYYSPTYDASPKTQSDKDALLTLANRSSQPFYYYKEQYGIGGSSFYTTAETGNNAVNYRDKHIYTSGSRVTFLGYSAPAYKDFLLYQDPNSGQKTIDYSIYLNSVGPHTLNGAGFLINSKISGTGSSATLTGYLIYYAYSGSTNITGETINLYKLTNVNVDALHDNSYIQNVSGVAIVSGASSITPQVDGRTSLPSGKAVKDIRVEVSPTSVKFYEKDGTNANDTYHLALDKTLIDTTGYGFGPFVGYASHGCSQLTTYKYDNLTINSQATKKFEDKILETTWHEGAVHSIININDSGIVDFDTDSTRTEMLTRLINNNVRYIGWGTGNQSQELGFIDDNNKQGIFVNSGSATANVHFGDGSPAGDAANYAGQVNAIAKYLVGLVDPNPNLAPVANIALSGSGVVSSQSTDPNGDTLTETWSIKEADGSWTAASSASDANTQLQTLFAGQNKNVLVQLVVNDGSLSSEPAVIYISNQSDIKPIADFSITESINLETATNKVLVPTNLSYDPYFNQRTLSYKWQVYNEMNDLVNTYTNATPSIDFAGLAAGPYEVKLTVSTPSPGSVESNTYVQQVKLTDVVPPTLKIGLSGTQNAALAKIQIIDYGSGPDSYRVKTTNTSNVTISGPWLSSVAQLIKEFDYTFNPSQLNALEFEVKDGSGNTASYPVDFSIPMISYTPNGGNLYTNFTYDKDVEVKVSSLTNATISNWYYQWTNSEVYPSSSDITLNGTQVTSENTKFIPQPTQVGSYYLHVLAINSNNSTGTAVSTVFNITVAQNGVQDLQITDVNSSGIQLGWTLPENAVAQRIVYSTDNGVSWAAASTQSPLTGNSNSAIVTGLDTTNTYLFKLLVDGGSDAGESNSAYWENLIQYVNGDSRTSVTSNVTLAAVTSNGGTVTWTSATPTVIDRFGNTFRPSYTEGNKTASLTATVHKGLVTYIIKNSLTVIAASPTDAEAVVVDKYNVAITYAQGDNALNVTQNVTLPAVPTPTLGSTVTWASSDAAIINPTTGVVARPTAIAGDAQITLTATITKNAATETKVFNVVVKAQPKLDADAIAELAIQYALLDNASHVTQNIVLPGVASNGHAVTWTSDTTSVIANNGTVTRPTNGDGNATVIMTAQIGSETRQFTLTVIELPIDTAASLAADKALLDVIYANGDSSVSVTQNVSLVSILANGSTVTWSSDNTTAVAITGTVNRPLNGAGNVPVVLTATISNNGQQETKIFNLTLIEIPLDPNVALVQSDIDALAIIYGAGDSATSVTVNVGLPITTSNGAIVTWTTSAGTLIDISGNVYRPTIYEGDKWVTLTATVTKGNVVQSKPFLVKVKALGSNDAAVVITDKNDLQIGYIQGDNETSVTANITLPISGDAGSTITWASDNPSVVTTSGTITRPNIGENDITVLLTATITYNGATETRIFEIIIKAKTQNASPTVQEQTSEPKVEPKKKASVVLVNGVAEDAGYEDATLENGKVVVKVEVDTDLVSKKIDTILSLKTDDEDNVITIPISTQKMDTVRVALTGDIVKKMESNDFSISIKAKEMQYIIPASEVNIDAIAKKLEVPSSDLKKIEIGIEMVYVDSTIAAKVEADAKGDGYGLVFPPVEFKVTATVTDAAGEKQTVEIGTFSQYVERILEIPANVDPTKITTGIIYNADGTISHIPTEIFKKGEKYFARLSSLTNSIYSVIWNPITVKSVENHWSKEIVNDMASRLIIGNPDTFTPDAAITRGDFAEYITKALGIYRTGITVTTQFSDVSVDNVYGNSITKAVEYGIILGYPDGTFKPEATITREEAMVMLARALDVVDVVTYVKSRYVLYKDYKETSIWARPALKDVVAARVYNGMTEDLLAPKATFTYAEAATTIKNLLIESELINK